jgi:hypothetical protein
MRTSDNPTSHCIIGLLMRNREADERTRTAYLLQLRVCGHWLLRVAGVCKCRISKRLLVLSIAHDCRVLRAG